MKIISWNVNGVRAVTKKENWNEVLQMSPDILAIQETKASPDQLTDAIKNIEGYHSFFDSSKIRKGYSGVAVYCKEKPEKVEYGLGADHMDMEGRLLTLYFKDFTLCLALDYGGEDEMKRAEQKLKESNDETKSVLDFLDTSLHDVCNPDLIIRTGGEQRTSGFMPLQSGYSEWLFEDIMFPDFDTKVFNQALETYATRERRFGK